MDVQEPEPTIRIQVPDESPLWKDIARFSARGALLGSAGELLLTVLRDSLGQRVHAINPHQVWMAPAFNFVLLLVLTSVVAIVARGVRSRQATVPALRATAYTCAAAQSLLVLPPRVGLIALLVLAAGVGVQAARVTAEKRRDARIGQLSAALLIATIGWAVVLPAVQTIQYRRALAGLRAVPGDRPNVLLLILDTVSAREMSLHGYRRRTTPTLDSIARHGVVFDRAIAPAPWTLPSHASMFSGYRADRLQTRYLVPFEADKRVVAEEFAEAGYVTGGFVGNTEYTGRASGLGRGFHRYADFTLSWSTSIVSSSIGRLLLDRISRWRERPLEVTRRTADTVSEEFLDWHAEVEGRPWFAFLNYYDAHDPYVPEPGDERRFLTEGQPAVYDITDVEASDTAAVASARALHDAALFGLDRAIGSLVDELQRRGDLQETIIVISSDHGEEWGEQGVLLHGNSVYLPALRVPLIIVDPEDGPRGRRIPAVVGTQHIGATLLDLAGLPTADLRGSSLRSFWEHGATSEDVVSWVEQAIRQPAHYPASSGPLYSVINDSVQVIFGADTTFYDLRHSADVPPAMMPRTGSAAADVNRAASVIRQP